MLCFQLKEHRRKTGINDSKSQTLGGILDQNAGDSLGIHYLYPAYLQGTEAAAGGRLGIRSSAESGNTARDSARLQLTVCGWAGHSHALSFICKVGIIPSMVLRVKWEYRFLIICTQNALQGVQIF